MSEEPVRLFVLHSVWSYCPSCGKKDFKTSEALRRHYKKCKRRPCKNPRCDNGRYTTNTSPKHCKECLAHLCKHCGSFNTEKIVICYYGFSVAGDCHTDTNSYSFRVCDDCGRITLKARKQKK